MMLTTILGFRIVLRLDGASRLCTMPISPTHQQQRLGLNQRQHQHQQQQLEKQQ